MFINHKRNTQRTFLYTVRKLKFLTSLDYQEYILRGLPFFDVCIPNGERINRKLVLLCFLDLKIS